MSGKLKILWQVLWSKIFMLRIKFVINNVAGKIQNGTININSMIKAFSDHKILSEIMFT